MTTTLILWASQLIMDSLIVLLPRLISHLLPVTVKGLTESNRHDNEEKDHNDLHPRIQIEKDWFGEQFATVAFKFLLILFVFDIVDAFRWSNRYESGQTQEE